MSRHSKLVERFRRLPTDFSHDELSRLLAGFGYAEFTKGRTSGPRVAFVSDESGHIVRLHKPHPGNIVKRYVLEQLLEELKNQGVL